MSWEAWQTGDQEKKTRLSAWEEMWWENKRSGLEAAGWPESLPGPGASQSRSPPSVGSIAFNPLQLYFSFCLETDGILFSKLKTSSLDQPLRNHHNLTSTHLSNCSNFFFSSVSHYPRLTATSVYPVPPPSIPFPHLCFFHWTVPFIQKAISFHSYLSKFYPSFMAYLMLFVFQSLPGLTFLPPVLDITLQFYLTKYWVR